MRIPLLMQQVRRLGTQHQARLRLLIVDALQQQQPKGLVLLYGKQRHNPVLNSSTVNLKLTSSQHILIPRIYP